jgi:hypothetical protein
MVKVYTFKMSAIKKPTVAMLEFKMSTAKMSTVK